MDRPNFPYVCIIELPTDNGNSSRIELVNQQNILGRHHTCTVQIGIDDHRVSNRHAVIMLESTGVSIKDLGSTNGVFVNGEQTAGTILNHQDIVRFGTLGPQLKIIIEQREICAVDDLPATDSQSDETATAIIDTFKIPSSRSSVTPHSVPHQNSQPSGVQKNNTTDLDLLQTGTCNRENDRLFVVSPDNVSADKNISSQLPVNQLPEQHFVFAHLPYSCFIERLSDDGISPRFELVEHRNILGRHDSCTVQIGYDVPCVSNRHAAIVLEESGVSIEDLGSTNGVFVNGGRTAKVPLKHHDVIRFGMQGPQLRIVIEMHETGAAFKTSPIKQVPLENATSNLDFFAIAPSSSAVVKKPIDHARSTDKPQPCNDRQDDNNLFDLSPGDDEIRHQIPFPGVGATAEMKKRLQQQMMNTQDIRILAKSHRMRDKIFSDSAIGEPQKHIITKFTNAYRSMKRTQFVVFGSIIAILCACSIWFAHGYFSYKNELSRLMLLKEKIERYNEEFEKARTPQGEVSVKLKYLYDTLQKVQTQYDSIKSRLELKDRHRIYTDTVEAFLDEIMNEFNEKNYCIPQHMLDRVKHYIHLFTNEQRTSTEVLMQRRTIFFPEIERVFAAKRIPEILGYVAMQESLLDSNARSNAGARGMWQFMVGTGMRFNLVINDGVDERLQWKKSTVAAADYFRSLLALFGDGRGVLLAIASYNAGEQKIKNALENIEDPIRDRDFWYLYRTSSILALETREYVPQVLARIIIDRHPDLYGFTKRQ